LTPPRTHATDALLAERFYNVKRVRRDDTALTDEDRRRTLVLECLVAYVKHKMDRLYAAEKRFPSRVSATRVRLLPLKEIAPRA
jgi:hypothetical protein